MQPSRFKFLKFNPLAQGYMKKSHCELIKKNMGAGNGKRSWMERTNKEG
jgi:hypothetical protein